MKQVLWVGVGGFIGAIARFKIGGFVLHHSEQWRFPLSTFCINVSGCFILGALAGLAERSRIYHLLRFRCGRVEPYPARRSRCRLGLRRLERALRSIRGLVGNEIARSRLSPHLSDTIARAGIVRQVLAHARDDAGRSALVQGRDHLRAAR
jgi:hypothetical protein